MAVRKNNRKNVRNTRRRNTRHAPRKAQQLFKLRKAKPTVVKNLAPIAETKKFLGWRVGAQLGIQHEFMPTTSSALVFTPSEFNFMQSRRDVPDLFSSIDGKEIFSKYLQEKLLIEYPYGPNGPTAPVRPLEIIYGFVSPLNRTDLTEPNEDNISRTDIIEHVLDLVSKDFDQSTDTMQFKDRRKRMYNITGRFKVLPKLMSQVGQIQFGNWGAAPMRRNIQWPMMKKIRYKRSVDTHDPSATGPEPFMYANQAYIPFFIAYNPDYEKYLPNVVDPETGIITEQKQIKFSHNGCHWFTDM